MAQRTTRQWIINGVMIVVTLSFMGISLAPLIGGIMSSPSTPQTNKAAAQDISEQEKIKIQIEGFEAVLKNEPNNQFALKRLVDLRLQLRDVKGAIEPLRKLADANPTEPVYRLELANALSYLKDRPGAIAEYRKVLETKPGNLQALQALVEIEIQDNRPEAAIGILQDALKTADTANKVQPDSVDKTTISLLLGDVYRSQKRLDEATDIYQKVEKADKKDFRPILGLALVKRTENKEDEAKALFDKASEMAPANFKDEVKRLAGTATQPAAATGKTVDPKSTDSPDSLKTDTTKPDPSSAPNLPTTGLEISPNKTKESPTNN